MSLQLSKNKIWVVAIYTKVAGFDTRPSVRSVISVSQNPGNKDHSLISLSAVHRSRKKPNVSKYWYWATGTLSHFRKKPYNIAAAMQIKSLNGICHLANPFILWKEKCLTELTNKSYLEGRSRHLATGRVGSGIVIKGTLWVQLIHLCLEQGP